jgi:5'(3')-deoxyribonucleotidase
MSEETWKPILAVDFDGVIHSYTSKWVNNSTIPDPPVPGTKEALKEFQKKYSIVVYSVRAETPGGKRAIERWLKENDIEIDDVTNIKPPAHLYIDDRAITFKGDWSEMQKQVETFKVWNR